MSRFYLTAATIFFILLSVPHQMVGLRFPIAARDAIASTLDVANKSNDPAIFVSQLYNSNILVLNAQGKLVSTLPTRHPSSRLATDSQGDLYVSGIARENAIEVFYLPKHLIKQISLPPGAQAIGVSVDATSGTFAIFSAHVRGKTEVSFYRHGALKPCRVVQSSSVLFRGTGGFDRAGVLYAFVASNNGDSVASVSGGCNAGPMQVLTFKHPFQISSEMMFNKDDNFVIEALQPPYFYGPIYTFLHPVNGQFGDPITTTNLPLYRDKAQAFGGLTSDGRHVFGGGYHDVAQYDYPVAGKPNWLLKGVAGEAAIAVVPPLSP